MTKEPHGAILNVSEIQHFSTGDGPGIRTTVFLKGCNLHCPWCHNPETLSPVPVKLVYPGTEREVLYGRKKTVEDIAAEVLEDIEFYGESGGLTLSGGEPMLQSAGAFELIKYVGRHGVDTVIDTAACVPWELFVPLLGSVRLFLVDYKSDDPVFYKETVGGDRDLVLENIRRLISSGEQVRVRVPLIPGVNYTENDVPEACERLKGAGVKTVDILPFHRLGSSKYTAMGKEYMFKDTLPPDRETLSRFQKLFGRFFECSIE